MIVTGQGLEAYVLDLEPQGQGLELQGQGLEVQGQGLELQGQGLELQGQGLELKASKLQGQEVTCHTVVKAGRGLQQCCFVLCVGEVAGRRCGDTLKQHCLA